MREGACCMSLRGHPSTGPRPCPSPAATCLGPGESAAPGDRDVAPSIPAAFLWRPRLSG